MLKKFQAEIPLPFEKSHELLLESGKNHSQLEIE